MKCPNCDRSLWFVEHQCPFCKTVIQPPPETTTPQAEAIGDALDHGADTRPLGPSDLSEEFKTELQELCTADQNIAGLWLTWTRSPKGDTELLAALLLDSPDEHSAFGFIQQANALGGPRVAVSIPNGTPTGKPFYTRREEEGAPVTVPDPEDEASRVLLPERKGQFMVLKCRTLEEANLLLEELAKDDILGIVPPEEVTRYRGIGEGYIEIQVSAAAYESASELRKVVEFHHQVVRAELHLPWGFRFLAFLLGALICPGLIAFPIVCYNYYARGYRRMARQALLCYIVGLASLSVLCLWAGRER